MRALAIGLFLGAACVSSACSEPASPVGLGGMCLQFSDCDPKYVCVKNVCTNDLDALVSLELPDTGRDSYAASDSYTPPADAYVPTEAYAPSEAGAPEIASPVAEAATPMEASAPPRPDANDSSPPPPEAAAPGDSSVE
jgi:hypothetical protein